jgi:hypothetical protein
MNGLLGNNVPVSSRLNDQPVVFHVTTDHCSNWRRISKASLGFDLIKGDLHEISSIPPVVRHGIGRY